jgi:hypothetical protein
MSVINISMLGSSTIFSRASFSSMSLDELEGLDRSLVTTHSRKLIKENAASEMWHWPLELIRLLF